MSEGIFDAFERIFEELSSWGLGKGCLEPLVNIEDRNGEVIVTIDLPYVTRKEDIKLEVTEETLEVEARMGKGVSWGLHEREFDRFRKSVTLPARIDPEGVQAFFRQGILKVVLRKKRKSYPIKVE